MKNFNELRVMSYELQATGYKRRVMSYERRATSYKLQVTGYKLRAALIALLLFSLGIGTTVAQKQYRENQEMEAIFHELRRQLPQTYLVRQTNEWSIYDLNYWFKNEKERQAYQQMFDRLFSKLDDWKTLRKFTESIDEKGNHYKKYTLTTASAKQGQTDFISLEVGDKKVSFQCKMNADVNGLRRPVPQQKAEEIRGKMNQLFRPYTSRQGVREQQVTYDWNLRKYHRSIAADNTTKVTRATRYRIPNCTQKDYDAVVKHFRQIQQQYNLFMATNDIFWEYEETAIAFRDSNGNLHTYGVALKPDGTLCLIESHAGTLPRLWAEDNAVWEDNLKKRPHYKTPENTK